MTIDYKLAYLSQIFSKIDRKGVETYVIARIWNKLDNLDLHIISQQYVQRENGYALLDLYFPQIKFGVEVNEAYHLSQPEEDKIRKQEVEILTGVTIVAVDCSKPIEEVHQQIDEVVAEINHRIDKTTNFKPWHAGTLNPDSYKAMGILKVEDEVILSSTDDICTIFETKVPKRGFLRAGGVLLRNGDFVWWPNAIHPIWANEMSDDGERIVEHNKSDEQKRSQHVANCLALNQRRITFYRKKDIFGQYYYRFVGVYEMDKNASKKQNKCVWRRISKEYKLPNNT